MFTPINNSAVWVKLHALPYAIALSLFASVCCGQTQKGDESLTKDLLSVSGPTFRVARSELPKEWTLIAYGDMRFTDPTNYEVTNPKVRRWLVDRIASERPDALLLSGDVPYDGSVKNDYKVYQDETASWRAAKLRVYPAMGNHELHKEESVQPKNWWSAFPELKGRRWYSVQFGDEYVITVDSNLPLTEGSRQQAWLSDQLAHLPEKTQFVFVSLHHPPVADSILGNHSHDVRPNEQALAEQLEKDAAKSRIKIIVIAGHIHNYQRFFQNGVVYLVSGGGGAKPYPIARTPADLFQDASFPNYHYLKFVYDGKALQATMYRVKDPTAETPTWEVKDTFTVTPAK
jgi:acid phosphatase type 7